MGENMSEELKFHQVAYVVNDLDSSVKHWADNLVYRAMDCLHLKGSRAS